MADVDGIRSRLETIAEELADAALDALQQAIDRGETSRPDEERTLTRARSAVERAITILAKSPGADDESL
ncbi:MAG TPA: hypothetical protein VF230_14515 [Acidimicrobiales bacterium]